MKCEIELIFMKVELFFERFSESEEFITIAVKSMGEKTGHDKMEFARVTFAHIPLARTLSYGMHSTMQAGKCSLYSR